MCGYIFVVLADVRPYACANTERPKKYTCVLLNLHADHDVDLHQWSLSAPPPRPPARPRNKNRRNKNGPSLASAGALNVIIQSFVYLAHGTETER